MYHKPAEIIVAEDGTQLKYCTNPECGKLKPLTEFHISKSQKTGRASRCRACTNSSNCERREIHKAKYKERRIILRAQKSPEERAAQRQRDVDAKLKQSYGITRRQVAALLLAQGGKCASCGDPFKPHKGKCGYNVDHDHKTGAVRGLLCTNCNQGIGQFKDSPLRLRAAIAYLERHATSPAPAQQAS